MTADTLPQLRCAVLDDNLQVAAQLAPWASLAGRVQTEFFSAHLATEEALVAALADFDIVVLLRERTAFLESVIARLPRLRLIVTAGQRNGSLAIDAARRRGIQVLGTPTIETPTAELTWALLLALARNVPAEVHAMRSSLGWQSALGRDMAGRTLGIIGLGRLGARVARVAQAFGMQVLAWSHHLTPERCAAKGVELAPSLHALLAQSDFLTIHTVLSARTAGLLDAAALAQMPPLAFLVNTSRAQVVDEDALIDALRNRRIAGAAVDVYLQEPLALEHPYRQLSNVIATPHIGYVTRDMYALIYTSVVEGITAWLEGRLLREIVAEHPAAQLRSV